VAYIALFTWSFLAATVLPLGSEPILIALVRGGRSIPVLITVATIGNYLGACTTYWLARRAADWIASRAAGGSHARALSLVARRGSIVLLLSWVPILGDAIVAAAGALNVPFGMFSFWVATGKLLRYAVVAWAASAV
jgi:membrane protein YqaA with SNARE-associated domain